MISLGRQASDIGTLSTIKDPQWISAAIAAAGDLAYRWDILSDKLEWSGNLAELLGHAEGDSGGGLESGHGFNNRIHPEDLPIRLKALSDHFAGGSTYDCEFRLRTGQGSVVWMHDRGTAELDKDGTP